MSIGFIRFLMFIVVCLSIARAYPSSMGNRKWVQDRLGYFPHGIYEVGPDSDDYDTNDNNQMPAWLLRSRKFCCAPPL